MVFLSRRIITNDYFSKKHLQLEKTSYICSLKKEASYPPLKNGKSIN